MSQKLIDQVVLEVAGPEAVALARVIKGKKNVSEFIIAKSIKKEINITRNILYRLYDANLVFFTRKKDQTKGWYIYYWTFNPARIKYLHYFLKKNRLEKLEERMEREKSSHFYSCRTSCIRLDFEHSVDYDYKCPECGELLHLEDNSSKIIEIQKNIELLKKEVSRISSSRQSAHS